MLLPCLFHMNRYSSCCFEKGCLTIGEDYATMSKVIMGNGGFYGCLSEPQDVSAWWKETAVISLFLVAELL